VFIWELGAGVLSDSAVQPLINSIKLAVRDSNAVPSAPQIYFPMDQTYGVYDSVRLSWYPDVNSDSFNVQVSNDPSFSNILRDTIIATATSVLFKNLTPSKNYYWRLRGLNKAGSGDFNSPIMFHTASALLNYPDLITPGDSSLKVPIDIAFKWASVINAGSYNVQISTSPDICNLLLDTLIVNDTSFVGPELENEKDYFWRVKSLPENETDFAAGSFSDWNLFTTIESPPLVPELSSPVNEATKISVNPVLRWNPAEYSQYYELRISTDPDFNQLIMDSSGINDLKNKIHNLQPTTTYYWSVKAFNEIGESPWSETRKFTTGNPENELTQLDAESNIFELYQNYPNPFNARTVIRFGIPADSKVQLIISDILGQSKSLISNQLLGTGIYEIPFDDVRLSSGVYFYTVVATTTSRQSNKKNFIQTKKMMIIK